MTTQKRGIISKYAPVAVATGILYLFTIPLFAYEDDEYMQAAPPPSDWAEKASHQDIEEVVGETIDFGQRRIGGGPTAHVRRQPEGVLSGRIIFTSGGHGWNGSSGYSLDRPNLHSMNEDYGNVDQMTIFCHYAWNAGATVVPLRPVDQQANAITLDQDDTEVTYTGTWSTSNGTPAYLIPPDSENYRFAYTTTGNTPTATARYTPNIPEAGYYPVYTWVLNSSNRINQEYIVNHAGGATSVRIPHQHVGKGFVWLGTYYFEAGTDGYVEITNVAEAGESGSVVIADAIRFGNGIGGTGRPRHEEGNRHWAEDVNQMPSSVYTSNVSAPPKAAAYMNNDSVGADTDRLYIGFHSNAGGGRGAVGLHNNNASSPDTTVHQYDLAEYLGREINEDMRQLDTILFPNYTAWSNRTTHTYSASFNYGELRGSAVNNEMDATIIEVAFHDSADDAMYMKDVNGRRLLARATMDGAIRYFNEFGGGSLVFPPDEPTNLRAENATDGSNDIVLNWNAPIVRTSIFAGTPGPITGHAPTDYAVYTSTDGVEFNFSGEVGSAATTYRLTGLSQGDTVFVYVTSMNAGGESFPSNVAGARSSTARPPVLIVDGFDRVDQALAPRQSVTSLGSIARVIPRLINDFSYVIQHGSAVRNATLLSSFDSATNDAIISDAVDLNDYEVVIWYTGEESTNDDTFTAAEQSLVSSYLSIGGSMFVSGAEIGWELGNLGTVSDQSFYNNVLRAGYAGDDANTYNVVGTGIFSGINLTFDDTGHIDSGDFGGDYDAEYPDQLATSGGSVVSMVYSGGAGGNAAVTYNGGAGAADTRLIYLGFPFETILDEADRNAVMNAALVFLADPAEPAGVHGWMLLE